MAQNSVVELAKQAYVFSQQIAGIEKAMNAGDRAVGGYPSYARNFNSFLEKAKVILAIDNTILETIVHLKPYDANKTTWGGEFEQIKGDLPVLKNALFSFCELYMPKEEKEKIGFHP